MTFYLLSGRQVDAVNLYKKYSKMLMDEFQLQRSQATQDSILRLGDGEKDQASAFSLDLKVEPTNGGCSDDLVVLFLPDTEAAESQMTPHPMSLVMDSDALKTVRFTTSGMRPVSQ